MFQEIHAKYLPKKWLSPKKKFNQLLKIILQTDLDFQSFGKNSNGFNATVCERLSIYN